MREMQVCRAEKAGKALDLVSSEIPEAAEGRVRLAGLAASRSMRRVGCAGVRPTHIA